MRTIIQFYVAMTLLVFCSCIDKNTTKPKETDNEQTGTKQPTDDWCGTKSTPLDQLIFISNVRDVKGIVQRFDKDMDQYLLKYPYYLKITSNEKTPEGYVKQGLSDYMKLIPLDNRFTEDMVGKEFTFNGKAYEFRTNKFKDQGKDTEPYMIGIFNFFSVSE